MLLRGLVGAGGKMLVAASAASALRHNHALVWVREIVQALAGFIVINNGPDRDFQDDAFTVTTSAVGAFAVASTLAFVFRVKAEMHQRVMALAGFHHNVAAAAAISAGRAPRGTNFSRRK